MSADDRFRKHYVSNYQKIVRLYNIFTRNQESYTWYEDTDQDGNMALYVVPIEIPEEVLDKFLDADKVIIMSGTLTNFHIKEIYKSKTYEFLEVKNVIPPTNRAIVWRPYPLPLNKDTDLELLAEWLKALIASYPGKATMVHATYGWTKELKKYMPDALINTKDNKFKILEKFKKEGGVWLAAGCAEGIDLPDDLCRLNITLRLPRLNQMADLVRKRRLLPGGETWYNLETLITFQQQMGRSVRWKRDYSVNIIADPQFQRLVAENRKNLSKDFLESIVWDKVKK